MLTQKWKYIFETTSRRKHQSQSWHGSVCSADMAGRLGGEKFVFTAATALFQHSFNCSSISPAEGKN